MLTIKSVQARSVEYGVTDLCVLGRVRLRHGVVVVSDRRLWKRRGRLVRALLILVHE